MYGLTTLENGLRVLTVTIPHVQSVSLGFFLDVGSRYESDVVGGASHFVEHMLFKGTEKRPSARDIAEAIEGKGGVFNASTGLETTLYWAKVAARHAPEALDVLSDMLLHSTFEAGELEKERAVITEEIGYTLDTPDSLAQVLVSQLQWPAHPLGRDIAGTKQSVAGLDRSALLAYLARHYRPGRAVLGLAGQVDHREGVDWARSCLSGWELGAPVVYEPAPANHRGPELLLQYKDSEQAHLSFSFAALSRTDARRYTLRLLNVILGEGMRSRLFQEVRERLGLAYGVDSYVSTLQDSGAIGIYAGVAANAAETALRAILGQLDRLRQEPVPQDELEKAREFTKGRLALALEDSFAVASYYAHQELLAPEVVSLDELVDRYDEVETTGIMELAQELFQTERLNLAIVGPIIDDGNRFRQALRF
jgi:predicted Zn-dependent peptidase